VQLAEYTTNTLMAIVGLGVLTMLKSNLDQLCFKLKAWFIRREKKKKQAEYREEFMRIYRKYLAI